MTHAALSARMDGLRSSAIRDLLTLTARPDVISLAGGLPDPDFIPRERISKAAHDALGDPSSVQYGETSGLLRLREVRQQRPARTQPGDHRQGLGEREMRRVRLRPQGVQDQQIT